MKFIYSPIFDERIKNTPGVKRILERDKRNYPSKNKINRIIKELDIFWNKKGNKILKKISEITNLDWNILELRCNIVGIQRPISEPLIIGIYHLKNFEEIIDVLIHELIHIIQTENKELLRDWSKYVGENYHNEKFNTQAHISINSIQWVLYKKMSLEGRIEKIISRDSGDKEYLRSWEIIRNETPEKLVRIFRKSVKKV